MSTNTLGVTLADHVAQLQRDLNGILVFEEAMSGLATALLASFAQGGKMMTCGNGGSAAEAAHLAEELTGRFYRERKSLPGMCLSIDGTLLTCIGNDYGFDEIFARQVESLGRPGDVFIGFTTSGNSENVLRAILKARERGLITAIFSGKTGGKAKGLCDYEFIVQSEHPSAMRIQECHQLMLHVLCEKIERVVLDLE
ncbi:MAG: SIS domain-containing protein [Capsulimonas sp.]|uniref:D-sedoheptulose-7-phosphate isomerase n=1 Tax=Capsulimonas sp. TaxID=2494211 RepID=UPI003266D864